MKNRESFIGKVHSVTGSAVAIQLDGGMHSTLPIIEGVLYRIGQIGSFVRIPLGYVDLFAVVTQAGSDALPEELKQNSTGITQYGSRWIKAVLIGERNGGKFERGVIQYPIAEDPVHLVTKDDIDIIYGGFDEATSIAVGRVSASESLLARVDVNKMINRHCAILGSTGSGKSNTVTVILEALARKEGFQNTRIVLIDPHGEYNEALKEYGKVFKIGANATAGECELIIPYWALPFREFISIFAGKLSEKQEEYVRQKVLELKLDAAKHLKAPPKPEAVTADSPIPFSVHKLWFDLDDIERQTHMVRGDASTKTLDATNPGDPLKLKSNKYKPVSMGSAAPFLNPAAQGILGFLNLMTSRIQDQRFRFLFSLDRWMPDLDGKIPTDLDELIAGWIGDDKPISILDLSSVPAETLQCISGSILSTLYDFLYWGQNYAAGGRKIPTLFVLEEAHGYLKSGDDTIASRIVQRIAKEGRKYGAGLLLVTQRPSELDETVLSQCGSLIALRMTNSNDRGHIRSAAEDSLSDLIDLLPTLRTGEGLIMGEIVRLPMRTKFTRAPASKGTDPLVSDCWTTEKPTADEYAKVIDSWRNNTLNN